MSVESISHARPSMREGSDPLPHGASSPPGRNRVQLWAGDEFSFYDLLDFINPLQHIPFVSTVYRELTGDKIGGAARLVGGALLGGPIGFVASVVNLAVETESGKDVGELVLALINGEQPFDDGPSPSRTGVGIAMMSDRGRDAALDRMATTPTGAATDDLTRSLDAGPREAIAAADGGAAGGNIAIEPSEPALGTTENVGATIAPATGPAIPRDSEPALTDSWRVKPFAPDVAPTETTALYVDSPKLAAMPVTEDAHPLILKDRVVGPWIADSMAQALDKYAAMTKARAAAAPTLHRDY